MNRRQFSQLALSTIPFISFKKNTWTVQLWRHATLTVNVNGTTFLVDPMLSPRNGMDPVGNSGNDIRIPMVDLPFSVDEKVKKVDAVIVTHTHRDHWDTAAQQMIDPSKPLFCQAVDYTKIVSQGFTKVRPVQGKEEFNGITIHRIDGKHGTGDIGKQMGTVSGFILEFNGEHLYVIGDSVWCPPVEQALLRYRPQVVIANGGGAQFLTGDPITMDARDIKLVSGITQGKVVAVHMDTVNHCKVTRKVLKTFVDENKLTNVVIPADGEVLAF